VAATVLGSVSGALASAHETSGPAGKRAGGTRQVAAGLLSDASGRPSGWAPVPFRLAELSVPRSWLVQAPGQFFCGSQLPGMIFAGARPRSPPGTGCHLTTNRAWILPAGHIPPGIRHRRPTAVIHGIAVYRLRSAPGSVLYLAPGLRVRVGARGSLARRALATLTWSPLAVVLKHAPAGRVPASWARHRFGRVKFAVPDTWKVRHGNQWATCGTGIVPRSLLLVDATRPPLALPCPFPYPTAAAEQARPGLTVVTGKYAAQSVAENFPGCQLRHRAQICLSSITGQGGFDSGVLIFSVSRPHQHAATFFLLGLSGSGAGARAIFASVRIAGR
jgi:hypothetical protein